MITMSRNELHVTKLKLECWQEVIGLLERIENGNNGTKLLTLLMRVGVEVPHKLDVEELIGHKVGILRSDDPKKAYLIRKVLERSDKQSNETPMEVCHDSGGAMK